VDDIELPDVHPKKAFMVDALDKEIRLSFAQRIKGTLPEPYQALISLAKDKDAPDFKYNDESTPFAAQGQEIAQLIRRKALHDEFSPLLQTIEEQAATSGFPDPELASTDVFVTSICWVGSKSLSHVLACIERCKERLLAISSSSASCRKQIITSVMEYWRDQTGVGVVIVDKLLNYQILTPASVIEWALIDKVERGSLLVRTWCFELVSGTMRKVAGRVKNIVHAIRRPGLADETRVELQQALDQEMNAMKTLFTMVEDAVSSVRDGIPDETMESSDPFRAEKEKLLKAWGSKWLRVFHRQAAVEEGWVREELAKPLPPSEPVAETMEGVSRQEGGNVNGVVGGDGSGTAENGIKLGEADGVMEVIE